MGIEWELMLVDPETGELVPAAPGILQIVEGGPKITAELLSNTIEITSDPRERVGDAVDDLRTRVELVRPEAERHGARLTSSGSHPFAQWQDQHITEKGRYRAIVDRAQWWGRNLMIWGTHLHVGVDDVRKVMPIIGELTRYLPHLQALSASSPFWAGEQTGYASNRALIFQQLHTAGLPWDLTDWAAFESYVDDLMLTDVITQVDELRWDVRPAPRWGTIELRACDSASNLGELATFAALGQTLVEWCSRRLDAGETFERLQPWYHRENKWRAARYGVEAVLITDREGRQVPIREHLGELLGELGPVAEELGCEGELAGTRQIVELGAGYQRQVQVANAANGELAAVVRHELAEFDAEHPLPAA